MASSSETGTIEQRMNFINSSTALLQITSNADKGFIITGKDWNNNIRLELEDQTITARHPNGEIVQLTFMPGVTLTCDGKNYTAQTDAQCSQTNVAISFYFTNEELASGTQKSIALLQNTEAALQKNDDRWQTYLQKILRKDMKHEYDRCSCKISRHPHL